MSEYLSWAQPETGYRPSYMVDEDMTAAQLEQQRDIPPAVVVTDTEPEAEPVMGEWFDAMNWLRFGVPLTEDDYLQRRFDDDAYKIRRENDDERT